MAAFIIIAVYYGILVYSHEFQYCIYNWLSISLILTSLNFTPNNQQADINIILNKCLCSIYSKRVILINVESTVFLIVFFYLIFFVLIVCIHNLIEKKFFFKNL